jgi:diamine N-acetyltransferase
VNVYDAGMISVHLATVDVLGDMAELETHADTACWLGHTGLAWHERAFADPRQEHLIAVRGGRLVGFTVLAGLRHAEGIVELRRIVVSAGHRHTGIGRGLLLAAMARAYDRHAARRIWLDVKEDNLNARKLYVSEGFRVVTPEYVAAKRLPVTLTQSGEPDPELLVMMHSPDTVD